MALLNDTDAPAEIGPAGAQALLRHMRQRHSARVTFDPRRAIPDDHLRLVLEAARWAPTAHNMQNFEIITIDDADRLAEMGAIHSEVSLDFIRENFEQLSFSEDELRRKRTGILAKSFPISWLTPDPNPLEIAGLEHSLLGSAINGASLLIIVTYDSTRRAPASEGDVLGFMSLGCVMENMWLMAESLGISMQILSTVSGNSVEGPMREILGMPERVKVAFGARLGYPLDEDTSTLRVRREVEDFVHHDSYAGHHESPRAHR